jgi:hypothetical protein
MADFAHWITAAEPALPWPPGTFLAAYENNLHEAVEATLEADDVAALLRNLVPFEGTMTDLLEALNSRAPEPIRKSRIWPKSSQALSSRVRRAAPALRRSGVEVHTGEREPGSGRRLVRLVETSAAEGRQGRHSRHGSTNDGGFRRDEEPEPVTRPNGGRHSESPRVSGPCDSRDDLDDLNPLDSRTMDEELLRL